MSGPNSNSLHKLLSTRQLSTNASRLSCTTSARAQIPDKTAEFFYTQQDSNAIDFDDSETADGQIRQSYVVFYLGSASTVCKALTNGNIWDTDCLYSYAGLKHR